MTSLLKLSDLSNDEIAHLLALAARFKRDGIPRAREGRVAAGLFFNPSLRTRMSFELASVALGAHCTVQVAGSDTWMLEARDGAVMDGGAQEHVKEAAGYLSRVVNCIGVRCFPDLSQPYGDNRADPVLHAFARAATVPVVNLESALYHPMQGLGDLLTLEEKLDGPREAKTIAIAWTWHPKALPMSVVNTALLAFARAGYDLRLVHPPGFELDDDVLVEARRSAQGRLRIVHDLDEGLRDAHVVYAKSWGARAEYGPGADLGARERWRDWIVDGRRQALGAPAAFMHCLPVRRNVVVADEVLDGPHSWVLDQAFNRLPAQAAVLHEVLA